MPLTGNKGEWSELYTFFKLLADGRLYCGDGQLNRYDDKFCSLTIKVDSLLSYL